MVAYVVAKPSKALCQRQLLMESPGFKIPAKDTEFYIKKRD